jgi:DNA anti-recombination protein RmuC
MLEHLNIGNQVSQKLIALQAQIANGKHRVQNLLAQIVALKNVVENRSEHILAQSMQLQATVETAHNELTNETNTIRQHLAEYRDKWKQISIENTELMTDLSKSISQVSIVSNTSVNTNLELSKHLQQSITEVGNKATKAQRSVYAHSTEIVELLSSELASTIQAAQSEIHGWITELNAHLSEQATPRVKEHVTTLGERLQTIGNQLQQLTDTLHKEITQSAEHSLSDAEHHNSQGLTELLNNVRKVQHNLSEIVSTAEKMADDASESFNMMDDATDFTSLGMNTIASLIDKIENLVDRFRFC